MSRMRKIADTTFGRNALAAGLICHVAAILFGMMSMSGADAFFKIIYPFSWMLLASGAYVELRHRGGRPLKTWRFYLIFVAAVLPVLGPLIALGLIYSFPRDGRETQGNRAGLFPAMLKLRASGWMILALAFLLFLLLAILHSKNDPYFRRRVPKNRPPQSVLDTVQPETARWIIIPISAAGSIMLIEPQFLRATQIVAPA